MTKEEFTLGYTGMDSYEDAIAYLDGIGEFPARCIGCDYEDCKGWQMVGAITLVALVPLGKVLPEDVPEKYKGKSFEELLVMTNELFGL